MKSTGRVTVTSVAALACTVGAVVATTAGASSVVTLPPAGEIVAEIPIPRGSPGGGGFAVGEGAVWVMSNPVSTLARIDPERNAVVARIKVRPGGGAAVAGNGGVWLTHPSKNSVSRIDPHTNRVVASIAVGPKPDGVAFSPGAVWVANSGDPSLSRINPATNKVVATIPLASDLYCCSDHMSVATGGGAVWVALPNQGSIVRVSPRTNAVVARTRIAAQPCGFLVADAHALWSSGAHCASVVTRLDQRTNKPNKVVTGSTAPIGLALASGSLWIADLDSKRLNRVDGRTGLMVGQLDVGGQPVRLGAGFGSIWVQDDAGRVLRINP